MSTQSILGVVGGVVGSFFGYPQLGFLVGSLIGAALTPKEKTEGPRIDDQKVTVSTYGAGIPTVYGTVRVGGNVVESTDKIELAYVDETGKGGGTENTTYRYFVHMRHVLCATPSDGSEVVIRKIWKDGKLIYDVSSNTPLGSALASADSPYSNLILYQGREDQMPDGIEELYHGVGNVPAYRGVVSVRLNIIECPGGRVPQFSFEISTRASVVTECQPMFEVDASGAHGYFTPDSVYHYNYIAPGTGVNMLAVYRGGPGYMVPSGNYPLPFSKGGARHDFTPIPCPGSLVPSVLRSQTNDDERTCSIESIDLTTGDIFTVYRYFKEPTDFVLMSSAYASCARDPVLIGESRYVILGGQPGSAYEITPKVITLVEGGGELLDCVPLVGACGPITIYNSVVYAATEVGGFVQIESRNALTGDIYLAPLVGPAIGSAAIRKAAVFASNRGLYVYLHQEGVSVAQVYRVDGILTEGEASWVLVHSCTAPANFSFASANIYASDDICMIGPSFASPPVYSLIKKGVQIEETLVSGIIQDQCERAGLVPEQFDVSGIDNTVWGYTLTNPASARANIQPLMTAFAIDATEEDGKIRFFHRATHDSVALISYDELGSTEDSGEAGDPMPLTRAQESELPRSVSVSYQNKDFDYQTGTERVIRQITDSVLDQTVDLPLAVDSDVAATVAQRGLYDAWNERNKRSFKVSRKFAFLSAGDVATIEYPKGFLGEWRLFKATDTGVLIEAECVPANPAIYEQTAVGGTGYVGQVVSPLAAPTRLQLLDIPILRDIDNNAGIYAAMDSYANTPASAELFVGDDETTLVPRGTVSASAPIGFAETALAGWTTNLVDETNIFTVNLADDVFNSVTREVLLANGGEFWALGAPGRWEIGCSALGASLGSGRYILSRHLRGLFGTEYLTGTHQANDTFVLLRIVGILRPSMSAGEIGQTKSYRAVTKGRSFDSASSQRYANQAEGLEPLSPVNARRAFANRDIQVDRRSRLSMNNASGTLPLGEAVEAYQWKFYSSSAFTTLIATVTTSNSVITEAQQTGAGVIPSATAYLRVSQISDSVGPGHELQATV